MGLFVSRRRAPSIEHAPNPGLAKPFRATYVVCPTCDGALRLVTANTGSYFITCDRRAPGRPIPEGERRPPRCGQTVHVVAIEGVAFVTPITKEQYLKWSQTYPRALEVYAALGIVIVRSSDLEAVVVEHPCADCGTKFAIRDLYAGVCRRCAGLDQKEA